MRVSSSVHLSMAARCNSTSKSLKRNYTENRKDVEPIRFFCRGDSYRFWGLVQSNIHLVCPAKDGQMFLLGTDRLGRDVLVAHHLWRAHFTDHQA